MKIKQFLTITNPDAFLRGNYMNCFTLYDYEPGVDDWYVVGEIELEVNVNVAELQGKTLNAIEVQMEQVREELTLKMEVLERRKAQLLALTHEEKT